MIKTESKMHIPVIGLLVLLFTCRRGLCDYACITRMVGGTFTKYGNCKQSNWQAIRDDIAAEAEKELRADRCWPPMEEFGHGVVTCTNKNFVNSECTFQCTDEAYMLLPRGVSKTRCLPSLLWSRKPPCCTRPCPPYARVDAFFVLDSSSSVGNRNWFIMKIFIRDILMSFTVSSDTSHFSVVRYNRRVDTANQIKLKDYPNDKQGLLNAFDRIPYDGSGTWTGEALKYVGDELMTVANGDRPNVPNILIVITDGRSQDGVSAPAQALRQRNVIAFPVGIKPQKGNLDENQLVEIAGSRSNILIANSFADINNSSFALKIIGKICGNPCED